MAERHIKVLVCDVLGTVIDDRLTTFRALLESEGELLRRRKGSKIDVGQFATAWYQRDTSLALIDRGELPWMTLDALHRRGLDELLNEFGIEGVTEDEKTRLNALWYRLPTFPDVRSGLQQLRERFAVTTLSNGNIAMLIALSRHNALSWDCLLSAELVQAYKPNQKVYRMAVEVLDLRPDEMLMVAAHPWDLRAAQIIGLKTAFIPRPLEESDSESGSDASFDIIAADFIDLAHRLK